MAEDICQVCQKSEDDQIEFGEKVRDGNMVAHYFCLLLSSGLVQNGEDDEGIYGFLPNDIRKEIARAKRLRCYYCKNIGATIGCCQSGCHRSFHLPCASKMGCLFEFKNTFKSYCHEHNGVRTPTAEQFPNDLCCSICFDEMGSFHPVNSVRSPCCNKNSWYHKRCLMQLAQTSGYFFKCPLCNNCDEFRETLVMKGVFIPDRDASWESEPNAFAELNARPEECEANKCLCPFGRNYDSLEDTSIHSLIFCKYCGSRCVHRECNRAETKEDKPDINQNRRSSRSSIKIDSKPPSDEYLCDLCSFTRPVSDTYTNHYNAPIIGEPSTRQSIPSPHISPASPRASLLSARPSRRLSVQSIIEIDEDSDEIIVIDDDDDDDNIMCMGVISAPDPEELLDDLLSGYPEYSKTSSHGLDKENSMPTDRAKESNCEQEGDRRPCLGTSQPKATIVGNIHTFFLTSHQGKVKKSESSQGLLKAPNRNMSCGSRPLNRKKSPITNSNDRKMLVRKSFNELFNGNVSKDRKSDGRGCKTFDSPENMRKLPQNKTPLSQTKLERFFTNSFSEKTQTPLRSAVDTKFENELKPIGLNQKCITDEFKPTISSKSKADESKHNGYSERQNLFNIKMGNITEKQSEEMLRNFLSKFNPKAAIADEKTDYVTSPRYAHYGLKKCSIMLDRIDESLVNKYLMKRKRSHAGDKAGSRSTKRRRISQTKTSR